MVELGEPYYWTSGNALFYRRIRFLRHFVRFVRPVGTIRPRRSVIQLRLYFFPFTISGLSEPVLFGMLLWMYRRAL